MSTAPLPDSQKLSLALEIIAGLETPYFHRHHFTTELPPRAPEESIGSYKRRTNRIITVACCEYVKRFIFRCPHTDPSLDVR